MRSRWQRQQQQALARDSSAQVEFCDENPVMPTQRAPKDECGTSEQLSQMQGQLSLRFGRLLRVRPRPHVSETACACRACAAGRECTLMMT